LWKALLPVGREHLPTNARKEELLVGWSSVRIRKQQPRMFLGLNNFRRGRGKSELVAKNNGCRGD
jgi:hypothetical protein